MLYKVRNIRRVLIERGNVMEQTASELRTESSTATLRLEVGDDWTVKEFESTLSKLRESYEAVGFFLASQHILAQHSVKKIEVVKGEPKAEFRVKLYGSMGGRVPPGSYRVKEAQTAPAILALQIGRINIASPGILDLLGQLNLLKLLADSIAAYRAETTKRKKIEVDALVKRDQIKLDFAYRVLSLVPESERVKHSDEMVKVAQTVIDPTFLNLEKVALDTKIKQVYLLSDDSGQGS